MKVILYHTMSKNRNSETIATSFKGDVFEIKGSKKPIRFVPLQMFIYGFKTVAKRNIKLQPLNIDLDKYDEIVLVSPVWAGRVNAFMRQFLQDNKLKNKKITIVGSCDGGYNNYFDSFDEYLDDSNKVVDKIIYVKGVKQ